MTSTEQLDHARSMELRTAVLSMLNEIELCQETIATAYYWAAYAKAYGMETEQAAFFGVVQATS